MRAPMQRHFFSAHAAQQLMHAAPAALPNEICSMNTRMPSSAGARQHCRREQSALPTSSCVACPAGSAAMLLMYSPCMHCAWLLLPADINMGREIQPGMSAQHSAACFVYASCLLAHASCPLHCFHRHKFHVNAQHCAYVRLPGLRSLHMHPAQPPVPNPNQDLQLPLRAQIPARSLASCLRSVPHSRSMPARAFITSRVRLLRSACSVFSAHASCPASGHGSCSPAHLGSILSFLALSIRAPSLASGQAGASLVNVTHLGSISFAACSENVLLVDRPGLHRLVLPNVPESAASHKQPLKPTHI